MNKSQPSEKIENEERRLFKERMMQMPNDSLYEYVLSQLETDVHEDKETRWQYQVAEQDLYKRLVKAGFFS